MSFYLSHYIFHSTSSLLDIIKQRAAEKTPTMKSDELRYLNAPHWKKKRTPKISSGGAGMSCRHLRPEIQKKKKLNQNGNCAI